MTDRGFSFASYEGQIAFKTVSGVEVQARSDGNVYMAHSLYGRSQTTSEFLDIVTHAESAALTFSME